MSLESNAKLALPCYAMPCSTDACHCSNDTGSNRKMMGDARDFHSVGGCSWCAGVHDMQDPAMTTFQPAFVPNQF